MAEALPPLRDVIARHGLGAKRRLGQHFLLDLNLTRRIARSAGNLMPALLKRLGLDQRRREAEVAKVWKNLIDPSVTAHAQPAGIHKGTLFVNVDSNVWLSEIVRYRRHEILERLQNAFGPDFIARISFRVG